MRNKHYDKKQNHRFSKVMVVSVLAVVIVAVSSIVGVMANTVPCTVSDGDQSYSFNLLSPETDSIIARAVEEGMEPLGERDKVNRDEATGAVTVSRCRDVTVQVDNAYTIVPGYDGDTVEATLTNGGVEYPDGAEVTPALDSRIKGDAHITVKTEQEVSVIYGGKTSKVTVTGGTVADVLKKAGIPVDKNDKVEPAQTTAVKSGMKVTVTQGYSVTLKDNSAESTKVVYGVNVKEALAGAKITLGADDVMNVKPEDKLTEGMSIVIDRVTYRESVEKETVGYGTDYEETSDLYSGETSLKSEGVNGEKEVTYREKVVNGESAGKEAVSEKVLTEAVNEVILSGTASYADEDTDSNDSSYDSGDSGSTGGGNDYNVPTGGDSGGATFTDYNGDTVSYSNVLYGSGTAYCVPGGTTSLGWDVAPGIVAVNPDIIPYGTRMYIVADGLVYGYAVAGDTGGALMSGEALVDVYYDTLDECYTFGRRDVTVYLL